MVSKLSNVTEGAVVKVRFKAVPRRGYVIRQVRTIPLSVIAGEQVSQAADAEDVGALTCSRY